MKIYLKSALKSEDLNERMKNKEISGIEIQSLSLGDDFNIIPDNIPIHNIHYVITIPGTNNAILCSIDSVMKHLNTNYAQDIFNAANKHGAGVVIHNNLSYKEFIKHPLTDKFINFICDMQVPIKLENEPKYTSVVQDVPKICSYINNISIKKCGKKLAYPLLDTCHLMMDAFVVDPPYTLAEIIKLYCLGNECCDIHFNFALGDGIDKRHGCNFNENQKLMVQLLNKIKEINSNANLILEVYENDYTNFPNARKLLKDILKYI